MYKNQLQELAQRSCFNLPSYTSIREGPDHAPRFKAVVNFNGECFECPNFCSTLRQAEHAAAEVALSDLSIRGPPHSLAARVLDETGIYKNVLQEVSQRVGASLPLYITSRSSSGCIYSFTCTVKLAGITFTGEPAKSKKQAEKNAAMAAWVSLKQLAQEALGISSSTTTKSDEQEQVTVARFLQSYLKKERPSNSQPRPITSSRIHSINYPNTLRPNHPTQSTSTGNRQPRPHRFPTVETVVPFIPFHHIRPYYGIAPPVTMRNIIPAYSAPPVLVRQAVPVFSAAPVRSNPIPLQDPRRLSQEKPQPDLANSLKELKI